MAIRRPGIGSPEWLFQDRLYFDNPPEQLRYIEVKYDGEVYTRVSQTYDYSDPPYVGPEQRGGSIVARLDYTVFGDLVTITDWEVNWRDEWPLRLASNYLSQCLYPPSSGKVLRVQGQEVYNQAGDPIQIANKQAYAFWASEQFIPLTNKPDDYLVKTEYLL
jgi:hypothetical protein